MHCVGQGILYVHRRQPCSLVQNLIVNFYLVVIYPQQCHIGINVGH